MVTPLPLLDRSVCPVCGEPNLCALEIQRATGLQPQACWCTHVDFSRDLLARIPQEQQGLSCICARCARQDGARS
ncbi:MAG: cysteine-rich CWC family protein [Ramlibacter sp.]|nr:cysteine-rich CWC family protein [Ramlibacter sp.]